MLHTPDIIEDTITAVLSHKKKTSEWPKCLLMSGKQAADLKTAILKGFPLTNVTCDPQKSIFMGAQIVTEEQLCRLP